METTIQRCLPCNLGASKHSDQFMIDLQQVANILIVQPNVERKASYLCSLMLSLASFQSAKEVDFVYLGNNSLIREVQSRLGELGFNVNGNEGFPNKMNDMIVSTFNLMSERCETLKQCRCKNIVDYNSMIPSEKKDSRISYVVILIEEIETIFSGMDKDVVDMLEKIATYGRNCGIHVIASTSYTTSEVLNGYVKTWFGQGRMVFKVPTLADSYVCFDRQGAESLSDEEALYSDFSEKHSVFYRIYPLNFE